MASVLVVDDDVVSREYLRTLCTHSGHRVYEAPDGDTALQMVDRHRPDAVITDLLMPGLHGCDLARTLRSDPRTASLPIAFNTAHYDKREIQPIAQACGVHDVIYKPATPAVVMSVVDSMLERGHEAAAVRSDREVARLQGLLAETQRLTLAGTWHLDPHTGMVMLSAELADRLGLIAPQMPRQQVWHHIHPDDRGPLAGAVVGVLRSGRPRTIRLRMADRRGAVHDLVMAFHATWAGGRRTLRGVAQDITEICHDQRLRVHAHAQRQAARQMRDTLHAAMVPRDQPTVDTADVAAAYLTAPERTDTGGDWYDIMPLPDGRTLLSIGAAAGHRIPGPAAAGPMRAVLRAYAIENPDPADVLARMNNYLIATALDTTYVTVLAALYDPADGRLQVANAGHPLPLLVTHDADTGIPDIQPLVTSDPPLGIRAGAAFHAHHLWLTPEMSVCAYTDGLIDDYAEAVSDTTPLIDAIAAAMTTAPGRRHRPTAQHLVNQAISALLSTDVPQDDICLFVLRARI